MIQGMLKQREADHQALNDKRLEHLWLVDPPLMLSSTTLELYVYVYTYVVYRFSLHLYVC